MERGTSKLGEIQNIQDLELNRQIEDFRRSKVIFLIGVIIGSIFMSSLLILILWMFGTLTYNFLQTASQEEQNQLLSQIWEWITGRCLWWFFGWSS